MNDLEAKDFLVRQTVEQAALDHVEFSDLERRMMYFTESGEMREDLVALNDAFEAEYDSAEYESKVSKLMSHALTRLKKEDPLAARTWDESIQELCKGDHYLLILSGDFRSDLTPSQKLFGWSFFKLRGVGIFVLIGGMFAFVAFLHHAESTPYRPNSSSSVPVWFKYLLVALLVGTYLFFVLFPRLPARLVF